MPAAAGSAPLARVHHPAAAAAAGFGCVLNVLGGFEGDLDEQGQRGEYLEEHGADVDIDQIRTELDPT